MIISSHANNIFVVAYYLLQVIHVALIFKFYCRKKDKERCFEGFVVIIIALKCTMFESIEKCVIFKFCEAYKIC